MDRRSTLEVVQATAKMCVQYVPSLAKANVVRSFSGIHCMPDDELPILGTVPGFEGLYIAATHSGISLSPLIVTLMMELTLEGETSIPLDQYSFTQYFARKEGIFSPLLNKNYRIY